MDIRDDSGDEQWMEGKLATLKPTDDWRPNRSAAYLMLRRQREIKIARGRQRFWLGLGIMVAGFGSLAFPATRGLVQKYLDTYTVQTGQTTNRRLAPDFVRTDGTGDAVQLSRPKGKVVLLNFWATWCEPCRIEIPWFVDFQNRYKDRGLVVRGVSLDEDGWDSVRPFISKQRVNYGVLLGGDELASLYGGLESLPTTLLIDRSGRIADTHVGLVSESAYRAAILSLLAEQ